MVTIVDIYTIFANIKANIMVIISTGTLALLAAALLPHTLSSAAGAPCELLDIILAIVVDIIMEIVVDIIGEIVVTK